MNDILAEWLTEMIQVFFCLFCCIWVTKNVCFFVIQDCSFFSILLYNTKIYIKLYPTRFLNCKKKKKNTEKGLPYNV